MHARPRSHPLTDLDALSRPSLCSGVSELSSQADCPSRIGIRKDPPPLAVRHRSRPVTMVHTCWRASRGTSRGREGLDGHASSVSGAGLRREASDDRAGVVLAFCSQAKIMHSWCHLRSSCMIVRHPPSPYEQMSSTVNTSDSHVAETVNSTFWYNATGVWFVRCRRCTVSLAGVVR